MEVTFKMLFRQYKVNYTTNLLLNIKVLNHNLI